MTIQVDAGLCEANGRCVTIAPEVFSLDDDETLQIETPGDEVDPVRLRRAVDSCPLAALSFEPAHSSAPDA
jgi:ferredoxin